MTTWWAVLVEEGRFSWVNFYEAKEDAWARARSLSKPGRSVKVRPLTTTGVRPPDSPPPGSHPAGGR